MNRKNNKNSVAHLNKKSIFPQGLRIGSNGVDPRGRRWRGDTDMSGPSFCFASTAL
jgi:hypothetical protein